MFPEPYTPSERAIFRVFNGKTWKWMDPVTVRRRLALALQPDSFEAMLLRCQSKDLGERLPAKERVVHAARIAFDMPFYPDNPDPDGYGATEDHVTDAVRAYIAFNKKKEQNTANGHSGSTGTVSTPTGQGESPSPFTTEGCSASVGSVPSGHGSSPMQHASTPLSPSDENSQTHGH